MTVLSGMRVVEGSAFVAVPLAGMTLAKTGAEVMRFDRLGGGLDAGRWPLAPNGQSLFRAGMDKVKKLVAVDMKHRRGASSSRVLSQCRVRMDFDALKKHRDDLVPVKLTGDRHGRLQVDYTVNPASGIPRGRKAAPNP